MTCQLVQLKQPSDSGEALIGINPAHVVLVEPVAIRGRALCRVYLSVPVSSGPEPLYYREVIGTFPDVLKALRPTAAQADPLGAMGGSRRRVAS